MNNINLVYGSAYELGIEDYKQTDLTTLVSSDDGNNWQQGERITSYLGNDYLTGITGIGEKIFVCFASSRNDVNSQGFYGIIGESEDKITPPILLKREIVGYDYEKEEINYRAMVFDNEGVLKVVANLYQINLNVQLFDDGLHNDSLANDHIFGNTLPFITEGNSGSAYAIDINKISLPFNNKGDIAEVYIGGKEFSFQLQMTDIFNNTGSKTTNAYIPLEGGGVHGGRFEEASFLFSSGFFLSGYSNGEMWSNAVAPTFLVEDYLPGEVGSDPQDPVNGIYVVNKRDPAFSFTWQNWKDAVNRGAEFYDGDGDGIYNPVDKNWNGTWDKNEDMPPLIGDEIAWCVYNDAVFAADQKVGHAIHKVSK